MIFIFFSIILSNFTDSSLQPLNERIEIRGCESDRSQHAIACADNPAKCVICGDSSGCNNQPATSKPTLSCVKCSDKERCPWGYNATATIPCTSDVVFPQKESCYTVANGDTVTRGCTMDAGSECTDDGSCSKCTESGCNRENVAHSSCFQCRSYLDAACYGRSDAVPSIYAQTCLDSAYSPENRGCYTKLYESKFYLTLTC